ncbi:MAG: hypothetical protein Q7W13_08715 [Bacteroidia bacterium]|nr:hypothetical protein [Bacteroidia bacterium]
MKVAIMTSLFTKRNMNINACHYLKLFGSVQPSVFGSVTILPIGEEAERFALVLVLLR